MHTNKLIPGLVLLLAILSSLPVEATYSTFGGETLGPRHQALSLGIGYPGLGFEYDVGITRSWDAGFRFELDYGLPVCDFDTTLGFLFSAPMRIQLVGRGIFSMALKLEPGLVLGVHPQGRNRDARFYFAGRFEPGVLMGLNVHKRVNVVLGMTLPVHVLTITDPVDTAGFIPIAIHFGTEVYVAGRFNIFLLFKAGPCIAVDEVTVVRPLFHIWFGFQYLL